MVDGINMPRKCKLIKENTSKLDNAPQSLSDLRLLCLNDIYLSQQELDQSTSRFFGASAHRKIMASFDYQQYCAKSAENAWKWCGQVISQPPADYIASLSCCARFVIGATASGNLVDIHTAQVLNDLLPSFLARPSNSDVEDTFVQSYLSPALRAVFHTDEHLQIEWANAALSDEVVKYKPDFKVSTQVLNKKLTLVVTEIKPLLQIGLFY